jgi:hypothetical protein
MKQRFAHDGIHLSPCKLVLLMSELEVESINTVVELLHKVIPLFRPLRVHEI